MKKIIFIAVLALIELFVFATNYSTNTFLIGWDNVMPEFNTPLNFQRSLFSIWQEYRGLGTLDGLAHAANLTHTIIISALSLAFPQNVLRYLYIHSTHLLGGIGMFFLIRFLLNPSLSPENEHARKNENNTSHWTHIKERFKKMRQNFTPQDTLAAFASLAYMFSIGTIQMYFAPLEVFATHFAALPILTFLTLKALRSWKVSTLIFLAMASFFLSTQGFVPTVFAPYAIVIATILLTNIKINFKKIIVLAFLFFATNAHWALPYMYSALNTPDVIQNARINEYSSEEIFYRNQARGDLLSTLSKKGFMLDTIEYNAQTGENIFFMQTWRQHTSTIVYGIINYIWIALTFVGIAAAIYRKKKQLLTFAPAHFVALFFLANNTPLLKQANELLRHTLPIVAEAYRIPFTKFETLFVFTSTIFLAYGIYVIYTQMKKLLSSRNLKLDILNAASCIFLFAGLLYTAYPIFQGHFTSPLLRLEIPQDYHDTFAFFEKEDPNSRIAQLPAYTFWNWEYRDWQHRGSGFLWYGIKQPILTRAFDPWSTSNEQFYNEIATAIRNEDPQELNSVAEKYDVQYFLIDAHVLNTLAYNPINYDKLTNLIDDAGWRKAGSFGKVIIYENGSKNPWVTQLSNPPVISSNFTTASSDIMYQKFGNYVTGNASQVVQLLPSQFTEKSKGNEEFTVTENNTYLTINPKNINIQKIENSFLVIPSLFATDFFIPVNIEYVGNELVFTPLYPTITINNRAISPQTTPIRISVGKLSEKATIELTDTGHKINISDTNMQGYLLKDLLNSINIQDGNKEATVFVDTQELSKDPIYTDLQDTVIQQISIQVPLLDAPPALKGNTKDLPLQYSQKKGTIHPFSTIADASSQNVNDGILLEARGTSMEASFYKEDLPHLSAYVARIEAEYREGLPLNFYIDNPFKKRAEIEKLLDKENENNTIILPPTQDALSGYGFHFIAKSVGAENTSSVVKSIHLYPYPHNFLRQLTIIPQEEMQGSTTTKIPFSHNTSYFYAVSKAQGYILLSQSYDKGWNAYRVEKIGLKEKIAPFLFGTKVENHLKANNWQNAWKTPPECNNTNCSFIIVYTPQYLQYAGFAALIIFSAYTTLVYAQSVIRKKRRQHI